MEVSKKKIIIIGCVSLLLVVGIILAFLGGFGYLSEKESPEFSESTDENGCFIKEKKNYLEIQK